MKKYIPVDNQDLIRNMKDNNFEGEYFEKENVVYWKKNRNEEIEIILNNQPDEAYIILPNGTHDHVPNDELWNYLSEINDEKKKGKNMEELIEIKKVDSIELNSKLIDYVKNFSWNEVKEHVLMLLNNWFSDEHEEWEANFVALYNDKIIGKISVHKDDYYPLPEIYPWVSGIFVSEEYRGHRISEKMIDYANKYLKEYGFNQTYIPTHHIGLYEKYGYNYVKDIVNYGGETDRLYVKKIK